MKRQILILIALFLMMFFFIPGSYYPLVQEKYFLYLVYGVLFLLPVLKNRFKIDKGIISALFLLIPLDYFFLINRPWFRIDSTLITVGFLLSSYIIFIFFINIKDGKLFYKPLFVVFFLEKVLIVLQKMDFLVLGQLKGRNALTGSIGNANLCAFIFVISLSFSIFLLNRENSKKRRYFLVFDILLSIFCVFLTLSRSGMIAMFILLFISTFIKVKEKKRRGFILLSCLLLFFMFFDRFSINDSILQRLFIWKVSLKMFTENPWFGVGLGNFKHAFFEYYSSVIRLDYLDFLPENTFAMHSHNEYLQMLSEIGALIFIPIIFLFKKRPFLSAFLRNPLVYAFLFISFFDFPFHNPVVAFFFLAVLGIESNETVNIKPETRNLRFVKLILLIFLLLSAILSFNQFMSNYYLSAYLFDKQSIKMLDRSIYFYENPEARYFRSIEYYENKKIDEAIDDLSHSLVNTYELPPYLFAIDLFGEYGYFDNAQKYAEKAYKLNPYDIRILKRLEFLYEKLEYIYKTENIRKQIDEVLKYRKTRRKHGILEILFEEER